MVASDHLAMLLVNNSIWLSKQQSFSFCCKKSIDKIIKSLFVNEAKLNYQHCPAGNAFSPAQHWFSRRSSLNGKV